MTGRRAAAARQMHDLYPDLLMRAGWVCECCGDPFTPSNPHEAHHRHKRSAGGLHVLSNLLLLTRRCHLYAPGAPHFSPASATANGWVISRHDRRAPAQVPALIRGKFHLLTDEGALVPTGDRP